jgi:hypothetical protein
MGSSRVFHPLLIRIGLIAAVPAAVIWAIAGPVPALVAGALLQMAELWRIRRAVTVGMPARIEFVPSRPADHPWIDTDAFRRELEALAELGFSPVADYEVVYPGAPDGLARVLVNAEARVYAEVSQARAGTRATPVATSLTSVMSDGWSLQTSSREPTAVAVAFMQTHRAMWRSLPQATPQDLLADHLELRERAGCDLGVGVGGDGSLNGYFTQQQIEHQARRAALVATNVIRGLVRGISCERTMPSQWLGEYAGTPRRAATVVDDPVAEAGARIETREPQAVA